MKKIKNYKHILLFAGMFVATTLAYMWFIKTPYFQSFIVWAQAHPVLVFIILMGIKITGILWPPLPGGYFTLAAVPAVGWVNAYLADFTGTTIGSVAAYYLGKKYGYKFLESIFDESIVKKIRSVKVKKHKEIETLFALRVLGGGTVTEAVCYGAGLLHIGFINFLIGVLGTHILFGVPAFYFAQSILQPKNIMTSYLMLALMIPLWIKLKGRYFE